MKEACGHLNNGLIGFIHPFCMQEPSHPSLHCKMGTHSFVGTRDMFHAGYGRTEEWTVSYRRHSSGRLAGPPLCGHLAFCCRRSNLQSSCATSAQCGVITSLSTASPLTGAAAESSLVLMTAW